MPQGIPPHGSQHLTSQDLTGLARAALGGSSDDRDRFLKACWQYAYAVAIWFGRKHQGAEDSAQNAALAVNGLFDTKTIKAEAVGGLIRVLVLRHVYGAAQRRLREATVAGHQAPASEEPDSAIEVETAEWARRVLDAVDKLPQPLQRVIRLRYWDGMSTRGIALELGVPQTSIMRLLGEAEAALKSALRGLDDADDDRGDTPPCQRGRV
jgi:RNA polymerase sigma factor (sigma-70 family)